MSVRCKAPLTIDRQGGDCADPTCRAHVVNEDGPGQPCTATAEVHIGNQIPQTARCSVVGPHEQHRDVILDSDDNAITHRWRTS